MERRRTCKQDHRQPSSRKLHIGCGGHLLDGWLNADVEPACEGAIFMDATMPMPFMSETFDYVFSEHMIEHITYQQGKSMLKECFRVLRAGGKVRVCTPDMAFLIDLYRNERSDLHRKYIQWATAFFVPHASRAAPVFVINNFMRSWGHTFIYDESSLRDSMLAAGFVDVVTCKLGDSLDPAFRDLENDKRLPPGFLNLESMILEGSKPGIAQRNHASP